RADPRRLQRMSGMWHVAQATVCMWRTTRSVMEILRDVCGEDRIRYQNDSAIERQEIRIRSRWRQRKWHRCRVGNSLSGGPSIANAEYTAISCHAADCRLRDANGRKCHSFGDPRRLAGICILEIAVEFHSPAVRGTGLGQRTYVSIV